MIDALIAGRLSGAPKPRTSSNGHPFATARVRVAIASGDSLFVHVIAFDDTVVTALLALQDGDSVALAGELTPKVFTDKAGVAKPSVDLVARGVMTAYHVARKRKAVQDSHSATPDFDDALPSMGAAR